MSSAVIVVAPVATPAIAAGAVVLVGAVAVAAAAVLVARAANAAIEGAVRAVGDYGEKVEGRVAEIEAAEVEVLRWQMAAADVVAVNARIRLLREQAKVAGSPVDVPPPLPLTASRNPVELSRLVAAAQAGIATAQEALDALVPLPRLTVVAQSPKAEKEMAAALASHQETLRSRYTEAIAGRPVSVPAGAVEEVLALLDPDATTDECAEVRSTAANLATQGHQGLYLTTLRQRIVAEINPKVERRRLAAGWVQVLEDGPLNDALAGVERPARFAGTVEQLQAVVAGNRDLTDDLRAESTRLMRWAQETADQVFVLELARKWFTDNGYQVEETFDARDCVGLRLGHSDWKGEYTADVSVDRDAVISGKLVREFQVVEDASERNRAHCGVFADNIEEMARQIAAQDARASVVVDRDHLLEHRTEQTVDTTPHVRPIVRYKDK
ncbi:hypothetical protein [Actinocrispum wychmicini]|uniref:Restriction endonuclease n=1 Tax=Actinocrispum wychmicini TaxID=1213861 RepID=A0A4R2J8P8_9PSEU|nr:hypothetical protein [Actinocrispum wychmicini]TCO52918.1 hypothetical protein EV192_111112 [Actinocrispum wychmicini]